MLVIGFCWMGIVSGVEERNEDGSGWLGTAEEMWARGVNAFQKGEFREAKEYFEGLLREYGMEEEMRNDLEKVYKMRIWSAVGENDFESVWEGLGELETSGYLYQGEEGEELNYWKVVAAGEVFGSLKGEEELGEFMERFPESSYRAILDVALLFRMLGEERHERVGAYAEEVRERVSARWEGFCVLAELISLMRGGELEEALELIKRELEVVQRKNEDGGCIWSFRGILKDMGRLFYDREEWESAIYCFRLSLVEEELGWTGVELVEGPVSNVSKASNVSGQSVLAVGKRALQYEETLFQLMVQNDIRQADSIREVEFDSRMVMAGSYLSLELYYAAAVLMSDSPAGESTERKRVEMGRFHGLEIWASLENWQRVVHEGEIFLKEYGKSPMHWVVQILMGMAYGEMGKEKEKEKAILKRIWEKCPDEEIQLRAGFLLGFVLLKEEDYEGADSYFKKVMEGKESAWRESGWHWYAMSASFAGAHEEAIYRFEQYLKQYPEGVLLGDTQYRLAYSYFGLKDYQKAEEVAGDFVRKFPENGNVEEGRLILADCLMLRGEVEKGMIVLNAVSRENKKAFEEAVFKIGMVWKHWEEYEKMVAHYCHFLQESPVSGRAEEALRLIEWALRREEKEGWQEELLGIYEEYIWKNAADWESRMVDVILAEGVHGKRKMISWDWLEKVKQRLLGAEERQKRRRGEWLEMLMGSLETLGTVGGNAARQAEESWMEKMLEGSFLEDLFLEEERNSYHWFELGAVAEHLGWDHFAENAYRIILRWHPQSMEVAGVYFRLMELARREGDTTNMLYWAGQYYEKFPEGEFIGEVMYRLGEGVEMEGDLEFAKVYYEEALGGVNTGEAGAGKGGNGKRIPSRIKALALLKLGELASQRNEYGEAHALFQRVYVMYRKNPEWVLQAYLRAADMLRELGDREGMLKTYEEAMEELEGKVSEGSWKELVTKVEKRNVEE